MALEGDFYLNKTPLKFPGTKGVMHKKPGKTKTLGTAWGRGVVFGTIHGTLQMSYSIH